MDFGGFVIYVTPSTQKSFIILQKTFKSRKQYRQVLFQFANFRLMN